MLWTFGKGSARLEIRRRPDTVLAVANNGAPSRHYAFEDETSLLRFQADMEAFLLRTGWSLQNFAPERRTLADRRSFPRLEERRRWWTDSVERWNMVRG